MVNLYDKNEKFRAEIINFIRDKVSLNDEEILDKKFKYNTQLGKKYLAECILSKNYIKNVIEVLANYVEQGTLSKQVP